MESKRDMYFKHQMEKVAEGLEEKKIKDEAECAAEHPIKEAISGVISPVKAARAVEDLKDDPDKPLDGDVPSSDPLPKGWDLSSLKTDGPIA